LSDGGPVYLKLDARQSSSRWQPPALNVNRPPAAFEASELSLSTRSRRCGFFCPTDRLPCKLPLAGVVVEIKIRENQPFADFYRRCEEDSSRMAGLKNAAACSRP
jgi:hypothetical protein